MSLPCLSGRSAEADLSLIGYVIFIDIRFWASGLAETVGGEEAIPFAAQRCNDATERAEQNLVLLC